MNRRERLMATLRGEAVDRPPVCFYEINGLDQAPRPDDPYWIFNDPSWRPLIELTTEKSDRIVMRDVPFRDAPPDPVEERTITEEYESGSSRHTVQKLQAGDRVLTSHCRRDRDILTTWQLEHFLKDSDDLQAYLELPAPVFGGEPDSRGVLDAEAALGDSGIVLIDTPDPLCLAANLFSMADYTLVAMTEPELFHRLLERFAAMLYPKVEATARALPGRLWRIYGPEYASPPYLPPPLFDAYVVQYDLPMIQAIQKSGGFARIHSHGRLKDILDAIASTGCDALDPIEPPPQGDVELDYVRERHGRQWVLFGNLEASDLESLPTPEFEEKVARALEQGTAGSGRGFVLMPSACPYGRHLSPLAMRNYEAMIRRVEAM